MLLRLKVYVNTFTDNTVREATPCCKSHELLLYLSVSLSLFLTLPLGVHISEVTIQPQQSGLKPVRSGF